MCARVTCFRLGTRGKTRQGKTINQLLPFTKSSPAMVQILNLVIERQLGQPSISRQDMIEWLMQDDVANQAQTLCNQFKRSGKRGG